MRAVSVVDQHVFHARTELLAERDRRGLVADGAHVHPALDVAGPHAHPVDGRRVVILETESAPLVRTMNMLLEAEKLADAHFYGRPTAQQAYQPLGDLLLAFEGAAPEYQPGDSLDLYAENDPAYVEAARVLGQGQEYRKPSRR